MQMYYIQSNIISAYPPPLHVVILDYPNQDSAFLLLQSHFSSQFIVNYSPLGNEISPERASSDRKWRENWEGIY